MLLATQTNSAPFGAQTDCIASCMRAHAHGGPGNIQVLEIRNGKVQFSMNIVGAGSPAVLYVNACKICHDHDQRKCHAHDQRQREPVRTARRLPKGQAARHRHDLAGVDGAAIAE